MNAFSPIRQLVLYIAIAVSVVALPQSNAFAALPSEWPHEKSDLKPDPKVKYGTLKNGLRFAVMHNETPAKQASIRLLFDVGSKHEYDDERGIAHFIEHMTFNGTKNVPEGEMVKMLERHGLAFGADANAYTSYDRTVYQLDLPNMKPETVDTVFLLMRETASNVTFDAEAIERERGVVLAEKRRSNIHAERSADARLSFTYPGTRMLDRRPIGTEEGISSVSQEQIIRFYQQFYRPENAFFVAVGDFDVAEITKKIEETFADWRPTGAPRGLEYAEDSANFKVDAAQAMHFQNEHDRTSISITLSKDFQETEDTRATRLKGLQEFAGNSILNTRLQNLRLDGKASYLGAGAQLSNFNEIARSTYLGLFLEEDKWEAGLKDAMTELNRALAYGFNKSELKELLANLRTNFEYSVSTADKRNSASLAAGILGGFAGETVFVEPKTSLEIFNRFAETISTDTVSEEFKSQWTGAPAKLFFISKGNIEAAEDRLLAGFSEALGASVEQAATEAEQSFAYTDFGAPGNIVERRILPELDTVTVRFANNVMVNLKKTDLQRDTVHMALRFGGGLLSGNTKEPGMITLLGGTFTNGGTEAHSATDLRKILAGKTASANMGAGTDSFNFRSAVTPKDQLIQLQLWAAYMTAPAYRPEPITHFQQSIEALYHALDNTPGQVARFQVGRYLYSGDPRFFLPSKDSIQRLGGDDVRDFMADALSNTAIEISIVGDIDIEQSVAAVAATFGSLPQREAMPRPYAEGRTVKFPPAGRETLYHKGGEDQAILQIYWPTADYSNVKRSAQLDLLRATLSDRVREAVREGLGSSYAPSVSNMESNVFPDYGYFAFGVDAKPGDIPRITSLVQLQIDHIIANGVSADDIERARTPLLEGVQNATKTNSHWLSRISSAQSDPDSLLSLPVVIETWKTTEPRELQLLAAEYLQANKAFEIHILPSPSENVSCQE